jgi:hypothetical protein
MKTKHPLRTVLVLAMVTLLAPLATADVSEIIGQFPANDAATANQLFDALLDEGEDALGDLCGQIGPLGSDDGAARYALTGLARYVSRPDAGSDRKDLEEVFLEALEGAENAEVKHFLLRQLQQCGGNETVSEISALLLDEATALHTVLTLDAIGTRKAGRALTKALKKTRGATQLAILSALADDGGNHNAARTAENRLAAGVGANECVQLLSILVDLKGDKAHPNLISAMDREEPRCRKAALGHATTMMDKYAAKKWRKKLSDEDTPDEAKREIGRLLAEFDAGE